MKKEYDTQLEKYKIAVEQIKYEGEILWQIMNTFMLVNTIYIGFIASTISKNNFCPFHKFELIYLIVGVVGLIITIAWLGTFIRNSNYYHFRMEQAKELEPSDFDMLKKKGEKFAEGHEVKIGTTTFQNRFLANTMKNKRAGYIIIYTFMAIYCLLIISSIPFCCS